MAEITGVVPPSKNTIGSIGDIYINTITGQKYELLGIYSTSDTDTDAIPNEIQKEYDWGPVIKNGSPEQLAQIEQNKTDIADLNSDLAVERSRINNITSLKEGSTTGDAELADGRTDYTGKTWPNIGEHIRGVSSQLSGDIDYFLERSRNLIYLNSKSSYPEDYSSEFDTFTVVDDLVTIKGTPLKKGTLYVHFDSTTFEPGDYYIQHDFDVTESEIHLTVFGQQYGMKNYEIKKITLTEDKTIGIIEIYFNITGRPVDLEGHIWITKDARQPYIKKGDSILKDSVKKTVVIFNYDMTSLDGRYDLMLQNGWSATWQITPGTDVEMIKTLVKNGQDLSLYSGYDNSKTVEEIRSNIEVKMRNLEAKGIYNTCLFSCAGHKCGDKLMQALSTLPFRYVRASVYEKEDGTIEYPSSFTLPNEKRQDVQALNNYRNYSFETIKTNIIDKWVSEKRPMLMLMLHTYEYDNFEENKFKQIVEYVKQLENEGIVKVMNARQYFEYYYQKEAIEDDRLRIMSNIMDLKNPIV